MSTVSYDLVMQADGEEDTSERMFELANAPRVRFTVPVIAGAGEVIIRQDPANETTGGCVWETSYLLAQWAIRELEPRLKAAARGGGSTRVRCLEVGAGCGLLGLSLAAAGADVVLTETASAMPNLEHNVRENPPPTSRGGSSSTQTLHWGDEAHVASARARGPFDLLLGTDVVYVEAMVVPLMETLWSCAAPSTTVWLCGQVRDPDAHAALEREAPHWFGRVRRLQLGGFSFADELECFLMELTMPVATCLAQQPAQQLAQQPEEGKLRKKKRKKQRKQRLEEGAAASVVADERDDRRSKKARH